MSGLSMYDTVPGPFVDESLVVAYIGPPFIGALLNLVFFGVASVEVYEYFTSTYARKDTWKLKIVLYSVLILATIQSSFEFWLVYRYGCDQNRDLNSLFTPTMIDNLNTLCVGIEGALVQSFLMIRAGQLLTTKWHKIVFYFTTSLAISSGFIGSLLYWIISTEQAAGNDLYSILTNYNTTLMWLIGASVADICVTSCLCFTLRRRIAGFRTETDSMLRALMKIAVLSSSYTTFFAAVPPILILAVNPESLASGIAYGFPVPLSSLYALSLLLNLNARSKVRDLAASKTTFKSQLNQFSNSFANSNTNGNYFSNGSNTHQSLNITFKIEQQTKTEDEKGILNLS